jgi:uncharacterized protein YdhG (YjbR/CyaY superfamily)
MSKAGERDVDAYIRAAPTKAQPMLTRLRELIKAAAPDAEERISYGMPFYEYHGRLVYFAGYANHVGLYAAVPANNLYAGELKKYMAAKSTIRFPLGHPLPDALVTKIVKQRVKENKATPK